MPRPTPQDPLGERPDAIDHMREGLRELIQGEVRFVLRGRTTAFFDDTPDAVLAMELIARGWVAYKPAERLDKV